MKAITSRQNLKIKLVRALSKRRTRQAEGLFVAEGLFHLGEALAAGAPFEYALACPEQFSSGFAAKLAGEIEAQGVPVYEIPVDFMDGLSGKEGPQGLLAVLRQQWTTLKDLHTENFAHGVAIVNPQDPGNLGSILRTIDAAGLDGLVLLDGGVDVFHPKAVRSGLGAHFWKRIARASFDEFGEWASKHDYHLYGSSARGKTDYRKVKAEKPFVLLLGGEREGLSDGQAAICEKVVGIPMVGRATSLNLAVAVGILIYNLLGLDKQ